MLTALWLAPALGGAIVFAQPSLARRTALAFAAAVMALAAFVLAGAGPAEGPWLIERGPALGFGVTYSLALDGLSAALVALTALLTVVSLLASWRQDVSPAFWASFLFLESALMGVFLVQDLFLFFVFWEATLVPMFFIIGRWGSDNRRHAAMKFFLFTSFGGLFMLLGFLAVAASHYRAAGVLTWDLAALKASAAWTRSLPVFAAIAAGLAVKVPLVPLHTWLPDAHTEAPAGGSVMLAGVMLKMGVYGFLRILMPLFPELAWAALPWLGALAALSAVYGSLCAMVQTDLKRLVAYSSVGHLGLCLLGVFSRTPEGLSGGAVVMIHHGLSAAALFLLVGFLYERTHRRGVGDYGDLLNRAPWMTFFFGLSAMAGIGLPGMGSFVGEFMSLAGMARAIPVLAAFGVIGVVLSAAYTLPAFQAVFWAEAGPGSVSAKVSDLDAREKGLLWALLALMVWIGLSPSGLLGLVQPALTGLSR